MSEPRVIKKYPNRRLYDTIESRYITLADVRRLVIERIDFVVADKKNNADITRSILLQVIAEQENQADPVLTRDFMVNVIRSYGSNLQALVSGHLDQSLKQFMSQQGPGRERLKSQSGDPPRLRPAQEDQFKSSPGAANRARDGDKDREDSNLTK
jgi:polyhydroxyalkanoate synthesis repressor PhaR